MLNSTSETVTRHTKLDSKLLRECYKNLPVLCWKKDVDWLYILPQCHANLTQSHKESHIFAILVPVLTTSDVYARFEGLRTFLDVVMSAVKVFVRSYVGFAVFHFVEGLVLLCYQDAIFRCVTLY